MAETVKLAIIISAAFRGGPAFDKAGGGLKGLRAAIKKVRVEIMAFAAFAAFNFLKKSFAVFTQFEQRMAEAGSIVGATREEIEDFSEQIKHMTQTLPQTADELGAGLYDVFSAGVTDTSEAIETLTLAAQAAVAGLTDTATSVKAGVSTMNAFGMEINDLTHIYDVQFLTVKRGIIRYNELSAVIGKIAPSAKAAGQSMEGMFGTLAFLTTKGMSAAEASTALGRAFDALTMPATIKKFRDLGVSVADMTDETLKTDPVLVGMRQGIANAEAEVRRMSTTVSAATTDFNRQSSELLALENQYDETKMAMQEFDEQMSDISLTQRKNRLEISKIRQQADREGRELTQAELKRINEVEEANDELAINYEELAISQTELSTTAKEQEVAFGSAQAAYDSAESTLGDMVEQQDAATESLAKANDEYDKQVAQTGAFRPLVDIIRDMNTELDGLSEVAKAQIIAKIFPQLRARKAIIGIMQDTESLTANIDEMTDATSSAGAMSQAFGINLDTTANDIKLMTNTVEELQIAISEDLLPIIKTFMEILKPLISFLSENTEVIWFLIGAFVAYKIAVFAAAAANALMSASMSALPIGWIILAIAGIVVAIIALVMWWDEITAAVKAFASMVWDFVKPVVDALVGSFLWLMDALGAAWNLLSDVAGAIANFFGGLIDAALNWGKDMIDRFIQGVKDAIGGLFSVFGDIWDTITGWIGFDIRANDMEAQQWGEDLGHFFAEGIKNSIPQIDVAAEDVNATLGPGLVNQDVVGGAGAGAVGGGASTVDSHDVYEVSISAEKIEEGMDMTKFVNNFAKEVDKQKKTKGSVATNG